jgi:hypothetical protein
MQPIDVVYLLGSSSNSDFLEFRLSLRSIEKYYQDGIKSVYTLGHKPGWAKGINHIPFLDSWASKDATLIAKTTYACYLKDISDPFLLMSDDIFMMRNPEGLLDKIYLNKMSESEWQHWAKSKNLWSRRNFATREVIKHTYNVEDPPFLDPHIGVLIHKDHYAHTMLQIGWDYERRGGGINTNYYQYACLYDKKTEATKEKLGVRFLSSTRDISTLRDNQDMLWLNINDDSFYLHPELFEYLIDNFEQSSKYEYAETGELQEIMSRYTFDKEKYNLKRSNSARLQGLK